MGAVVEDQIDLENVPKEIVRLLTTRDEVRRAVEEIQSRTREKFDRIGSLCTSLLVGHGAAAIGAMQLVGGASDYQKSAVFFAGVFCVGFCFAAASVFFGSYSYENMTRRYWERDEPIRRADLWLMGLSAAISFLILILSVGSIGVRFIEDGWP